MSSRKLRVQLAQLLKEKGYGKLYTCPRNQALRTLRSYELRDMINFLLSVKVGDVFYEWGYNRIVAKEPICFWKAPIKKYKKHNVSTRGNGITKGGVYCGVDQIEYTDGVYSCGCGSYDCFKSNSAPKTKQEIVAIFEIQKDSEWGYDARRYFKLLEMGHDLIDENGFAVSNYKELCKLYKE